MNPSRRTFLKTSLAAGAWAGTRRLSSALTGEGRPFPIGLQLYTVRNELPKDYEGTLAKIAAIGYQDVEAAGYFGHTAAQVKQMMQRAGLRCVSSHYPLQQLVKSLPESLDFAHTAGLEYLVAASPWSGDPAHITGYPGGAWMGLEHAMTMDDWKWTAEHLQSIGERCKQAGIQLAYHSHTMSFQKHGDTNGFAVLMHATSPEVVALELDCGWAVAAGQNPVELLQQHAKRIQLLHVKDMKPTAPGTPPWEYVPTELGHGTIHYQPILDAARKAAVKYVFVEQDSIDMPIWDALKVDYDYMRRIDRG